MSAARDHRTGVALLLNSLRFGGAEKQTLQLFNHLDAHTYRVGLAYLKREEHLRPEADPSRGPVWCAEFERGWDFSGLRRLAKWLKAFDPDVLLCVNTYPLFYGHLARALSRSKPRIFEVFHSTELPERKERRIRLGYRHLFNRSDQIVYVSHAQRLYWERRGFSSERGTVIHNGVDTRRFRNDYTREEKLQSRRALGLCGSDFVVGICAALRPEKQHEDLLSAVARLKAQGLPAKCLIIGDGPRRQAIEEKVRHLGLAGDVFITGFQADVRPFVAISDCMAIVSHQVETFSIAALEAMAMGRPMVMSAIGGAAEQVTDGVNGFLYPAGDVDALTAALRNLAEPRCSAEMGHKARERVISEFALEVMVNRYEQLCQQFVVNPGA